MNDKDILDCMNNIDADLIENADKMPPKKRHIQTAWKWVALAACLTLFIGSGFGIHAYAVNQREYKEAVAFFEENGLLSDGLSKGEIKAVYRDITAEQFTFGKTAEVLQNSLKAQIPGYEIKQDDPTPEYVESLWVYKNGYPHLVHPDKPEYKIDIVEKTDPKTGVPQLEKSVIRRYEGDKCLWETDIKEFSAFECRKTSHGPLVWGTSPSGTGNGSRAAVSLLDNDGKILWLRFLDNGFSDEYIGAAAENADGSIEIFSRGDLKYLCVSRYGADGRCLKTVKHSLPGFYGIKNAARFGNDYMVQLVRDSQDKIVRITESGEIAGSFCYTSEDVVYYITDMQEFNGNLYISAYTTPKTQESGWELYPIVKEHGEDLINMSEKELTGLIRENYHAVLLVCAPDGNKLQEFYSVKGNLGADLHTDKEDRLIWQTENIQSVYYSPATNSFAFGGISDIDEYAFSADGVLESCTKTGRHVDFRK